MDYPEIDRYSSIDSPIHNFDPRAKIITFMVMIFSFVFLDSITKALVGLGIASLIYIIAKLPKAFVIHRLKVVFLFLFPLLIIMPLTVDGQVIAQYHSITITMEGVRYSSLVIIRALSAVTLALIMLGTTRFDITIKALYMLKVPGTLIQMLMFTYRYIFVIIDEFQRMWKAMESKGFKLKANRYGLSVLGNMIGMLIIKSYDRAQRVYHSMISKGYTGNPKTIVNFELRTKDYTIALSMILIALLMHTYHLVL
ncbi:cobalt ECF transporter T component CbiQ [Methanococcoides methylutens]|uniref:cobalt ECF transporter T component CbiQ n=1 Tax=Methanococcoides methylutens TaxID=2226 RepID=UPI004044DF5C